MQPPAAERPFDNGFVADVLSTLYSYGKTSHTKQTDQEGCCNVNFNKTLTLNIELWYAMRPTQFAKLFCLTESESISHGLV